MKYFRLNYDSRICYAYTEQGRFYPVYQKNIAFVKSIDDFLYPNGILYHIWQELTKDEFETSLKECLLEDL